MTWFLGVVASALFTMLIGIPAAARLARVQIWKTTTRGIEVSRAPVRVHDRFELLDLGPDKMRWPSEFPRENTSMEVPPWPSEKWDDPYFGKDRAVLPSLKPAVEREEEPQAPVEKPKKQVKTKVKQRVKRPREVSPPEPVSSQPAAPAVEDGLPSREELESMIQNIGLAGTVQQLRESQGWDFKQAASWLARTRKG